MGFFSRPTAPAVVKPAKISLATAAARTFIHRFHVPGYDRGTIHTFGNTHRVETPLDADPGRLHQGLDQAERAVRSGANEGTRLYAAIADVLTHLLNHADPRNPWVPIVVTDGMDNQSRVTDFDTQWKDKQQLVPNARFAGEMIAQGLTAMRSVGIVCQPIVVGVGGDRQIDAVAIGALGQAGGFPTFHISGFDQLADLLTAEVTRLVVTDRLVGHRVGNLKVVTAHQTARVHRFPVEYAIVMDRSGSMNAAE